MKLKRTKKSPTASDKSQYKITSDLYETNFDSLDSESNLYLTIEDKETNDEFTFNLNIQTDSYCCGLVSIGDFTVDNDGIDDDIVIKFMKEFFIRLHKAAREGDKELAIVFTLVDDEACDYILDAIKTETHYTCVKTFTNTNSGCENKVYLNN